MSEKQGSWSKNVGNETGTTETETGLHAEEQTNLLIETSEE